MGSRSAALIHEFTVHMINNEQARYVCNPCSSSLDPVIFLGKSLAGEAVDKEHEQGKAAFDLLDSTKLSSLGLPVLFTSFFTRHVSVTLPALQDGYTTDHRRFLGACSLVRFVQQ